MPARSRTASLGTEPATRGGGEDALGTAPAGGQRCHDNRPHTGKPRYPTPSLPPPHPPAPPAARSLARPPPPRAPVGRIQLEAPEDLLGPLVRGRHGPAAPRRGRRALRRARLAARAWAGAALTAAPQDPPPLALPRTRHRPPQPIPPAALPAPTGRPIESRRRPCQLKKDGGTDQSDGASLLRLFEGGCATLVKTLGPAAADVGGKGIGAGQTSADRRVPGAGPFVNTLTYCAPLLTLRVRKENRSAAQAASELLSTAPWRSPAEERWAAVEAASNARRRFITGDLNAGGGGHRCPIA